MASADFTINGQGSPVTLAAGQSFTLAIKSVTGVRHVAWRIAGTSGSAIAAPALTLSGSPYGSTATGTMPSVVGGEGASFLVECVVNGGVDDEGQPRAELRKTGIFGAVNGRGKLPLCVGEEFERNATHGIADDMNAQLGTGGGGGVTELDGDVTGPSDDTTVEAIQGVPVEAGTPSDKDVLAFDAGDGKAKWQPPAIPAAAQVPFDKTGTGLAAEDVQAAIVELASGVVPASPYLAAVELALPTDGDPADELVYTVPACHAAIISRVLVVVSGPLVGAGSVTVRAGDAAGDDGYLIDKAITSSSEGIVAGESIASLGALFPAATGYEAVVATGDEIHVRLTPTGEVTDGKVKVFVCGTVLT